MDKITPNKRKSLANAKATPNKIQKITHTPVSQKINNKSPKSANKIIQKQNNGYKSPKSPNKNQKTPQKNQINGKKITSDEVKKNKQIEDDETEFMDESDNSIDEPIGNSNNSDDAADSDEEAEVDEDNSDEDAEVDEVDLEVDEADSDEEAEVDEADSDEEAELEEADSDEEAEVNEADSNEEAEVDEESDSSEEAEVDEANLDEPDKNMSCADEVKNKNERNSKKKTDFVVFLKDFFKAKDVFRGHKIMSVNKLRDPITNIFTGNSYVYFEDHESMMKAIQQYEIIYRGSVIIVDAAEKRKTEFKKALDKNQKKYNNEVIKIETLKKDNTKSGLCVFVKGIHPNLKIQDIFSDCKIDTFRIVRHPKTNKFRGQAYITFKDTETVKKAIAKNETIINGSLITVVPTILRNPTEFTVFVKGLKDNMKVEDIFKDCNMRYYILKRDRKTNVFIGAAYVYFEDEESVQKALSKNGTKFDGKTIIVEINKKPPVKSVEINKKPLVKSEHRSYIKPFRRYPRHNPVEFMQKKILYDVLKSQTQELERELFGNTKTFYRKNFNK